MCAQKMLSVLSATNSCFVFLISRTASGASMQGTCIWC